MAKYELKAEHRKETGRSASRRMQRLEDKVPAIIYGGGKDQTLISMTHKDVVMALTSDKVFSSILTIDVGSHHEKVILKDLLRHPVKARILHIDFLRINEKQKLTIHIPLHYSGDALAPGIKAGGIFSKHMNEVEIRCLPADLPESINIDLSGFELNQTLHLSDLKLPKGVELAVKLVDEQHNQPVVSIHMPRAEKEEVEETAAPAEGAAPGATAEGAKAEGEKAAGKAAAAPAAKPAAKKDSKSK